MFRASRTRDENCLSTYISRLAYTHQISVAAPYAATSFKLFISILLHARSSVPAPPAPMLTQKNSQFRASKAEYTSTLLPRYFTTLLLKA
jgi:hypothetical protein